MFFFSLSLLQLTSHHVVHQALVVGLFTRLLLAFTLTQSRSRCGEDLGVKERSGTGRSGRKMQQRFGCLIKSQQLAGQAAFIKAVVWYVQSLGWRKRRRAGLKYPVKSFRETKTTAWKTVVFLWQLNLSSKDQGNIYCWHEMKIKVSVCVFQIGSIL